VGVWGWGARGRREAGKGGLSSSPVDLSQGDSELEETPFGASPSPATQFFERALSTTPAVVQSLLALLLSRSPPISLEGETEWHIDSSRPATVRTSMHWPSSSGMQHQKK